MKYKSKAHRYFTLLVLVIICVHTSNNIYAQTKRDVSQWKQLFNGKDLSGWKHVGGGNRFVEEGLLASKGGMGLLYWTGKKIRQLCNKSSLQNAKL